MIAGLNAQDLLNYSNSSKYAEFLFQNKQYYYSAIEFERVTFLEPNDTLAKLRLVQSYRLLNDFKNMKAKLDGYFVRPENYPGVFANEYFRILFQDKQYSIAFDFIKGNKTLEPNKKIEYELGTLLMLNKYKQARIVAEDVQYLSPKPPKFEDLHRMALQGMNIKYKNPYCAAICSAIIPGSGKIYTKHWADAIFSFLFIFSSSILTYRSVEKNGLNAKSFVYGSISLWFYSANIYGSFKSAKEYNSIANQKVTRNIETILFDK
jgi:hypothetical protein